MRFGWTEVRFCPRIKSRTKTMQKIITSDNWQNYVNVSYQHDNEVASLVEREGLHNGIMGSSFFCAVLRKKENA